MHRTSRGQQFIHQYRASVLSDRRKKLPSFEAMSLVRPLHACDESLLAEDVLRLSLVTILSALQINNFGM